MTEFNSSLGHQHLVNNDSNGLNLTSRMSSSLITNSTSEAVENNLKAAGFWTLKDVVFVSALTLCLFIFSIIFYWGRHLILKRWPNCSSVKTADAKRFENLDEEYPKENWFGEDQGTNLITVHNSLLLLISKSFLLF